MISCFVLICCILCHVAVLCQQGHNDLVGFTRPEHPLNFELFSDLKLCDANLTKCEADITKITSLFAKVANEHGALLLHDRALDIFEDIVYFMQTDHILGKRAAHILSVLSFAQGRTVQVSSSLL